MLLRSGRKAKRDGENNDASQPEDPAAKAYMAISSQLRAWDQDGNLDGDDDDDDDGYNDSNSMDVDPFNTNDEEEQQKLSTPVSIKKKSAKKMSSLSPKQHPSKVSWNAESPMTTTTTSSHNKKTPSSLSYSSSPVQTPAIGLSSAKMYAPVETPHSSKRASHPPPPPPSSSPYYSDDLGSPMSSTSHKDHLALQAEQQEDEFYSSSDEDEEEGAIVLHADHETPYHEAYLTFLSNMRSSRKQSEIARDQNDFKEINVLEEEREGMELEFLDAMTRVCRDRRDPLSSSWKEDGGEKSEEEEEDEISARECDFWMLLRRLRALGRNSLFYDNTFTKLAYDSVMKSLVMDLLADGGAEKLSPFQLVNRVKSIFDDDDKEETLKKAAMLWKRGEALSRWTESCISWRMEDDNSLNRSMQTLRSRGPKKVSGSLEDLHPDAALMKLFGGSDDMSGGAGYDEQDKELLQACVSLIRCGRWEDAAALCRECGCPWRACTFYGGSELHNDGIDNRGNPARKLWFEQATSSSKILTQKVIDLKELDVGLACEAAIFSFVSGDVKSGMSNPILNTWLDGVLLHTSSLVRHRVDDILKILEEERKRIYLETGRAFPSTLYDHAQGQMDNDNNPPPDEGEIFDMLSTSTSPHHDGICEEASDPRRIASAAFITGISDLSHFLRGCSDLVLGSEGNGDDCDLSLLRFLVHLLLYIDTIDSTFLPLHVDSNNNDETPISSVSVREKILLQYIQRLSSSPLHWPSIEPYTSLLEATTSSLALESYSSHLLRIYKLSERQEALKRAKIHLPLGMDLEVLRKVGLSYWSEEGGEGSPPKSVLLRNKCPKSVAEKVGDADAKMMCGVSWFFVGKEYSSDGLFYSNRLLRTFLLGESEDGGMFAARVFLDYFVPKDLVDMANKPQEETSKDNEEERKWGPNLSPSYVQDLAVEYGALARFIQARRVYDTWVKVLESSSPNVKINSKLDRTTGSSKDDDASKKMKLRAYLRKKNELGRMVMEAAHSVQNVYNEVLQYPGGWLISDQEENYKGAMEEDGNDMLLVNKSRLVEMEQLRQKCLPQAVHLLYDTLNRTAEWMQEFVNDAKQMHIDMDVSSSPMTPEHWHRSALSLANTVAADEFGVHEAFDWGGLKKFLDCMKESEYKLSLCEDGWN